MNTFSNVMIFAPFVILIIVALIAYSTTNPIHRKDDTGKVIV